MNKGPNLLPIAMGLLLIGVLSVGGLFFWQKFQDQSAVTNTSDTSTLEASLTVCGDPWIGYMPIASDTLQHDLRRDNIAFEYISDGGNYEERMSKVRSGDCDFAAVTVDANILNTPDFNRGGVIIAVLDQSSGGDAMVCNNNSITSIDDFNLRQGWKVAFTPDSPSHQLIRGLGNDFGVDTFLSDGEWKVESNGSSEALSSLQDGSASCAVLWQPDVARALQDSNMSVLYSSADADKLIVDVLMAHRGHMLPSSENRSIVELVLQKYFETLKEFSNNPGLQMQEVKTYLRSYDGGRYSDEEIQSMLSGVDWVNLRENGESWFGIGGDSPYFGLVEAHEFALSIIRAEKGTDFLRFFRPESIIDSRIITKLYGDGVLDEQNSTVTNPLELRFSELSELYWNSLETQGLLRSRRIVFQSGSLVLEDFSRRALGEAMGDFKRYPASRLEIQIGYVVSGDVEAAMANAESRANAVHDYLVETYNLDPNRMRVYVPEPIDMESVIPKRDDEGGRAYRSRLREVRLVLRRENQT